MEAGIDAVQMRSPGRQKLLKVRVDLIHQGGGEIAPGRPGLIGDDHHLHSRLIEAADGRDRLGQQLETG